MITIISGTNRPGSRTRKVAGFYLQQLQQTGCEVQLLSLERLRCFERNESLLDIEKNLLIPAEKFVIVMPEYNGSFPGILKALFDITNIKQCWWHKKALLVGLADGRGGNLRGLEHMTNILHYLKMNVHYNKLPLSRINNEMDEAGNFINAVTENTIKEQITEFIAY